MTQSTLGENLSKVLGLPLLRLDAISHQPYFQDTPPEIFRSQVVQFIESNQNGWIIDGNYRNILGHITWGAASDIVWLDYPIYVVLWRLWFRTIGRIRSSEKLWGLEGCVETWQSQFLSKDSLLYVPWFSTATYLSLWVFYFYHKRRPVFHEELVAKKKGLLEGVNVIRFQWPSETASWLDRIRRDEKSLDK